MHQGNHANQSGFGASKSAIRDDASHSGIKQEYGHRPHPLLHAGGSSMERGATDNSQDPPPAVGYVTQQEPRSASYSTEATPTPEYGLYPGSARSGSFPSYAHPANHPGLAHNPVSHGGLNHNPGPHSCANPPCGNPNCGNPACASQAGNTHPPSNVTMAPTQSNPPVPTPSPGYPPTHYQAFPPPPHGMPHGYPHPGGAPLYPQQARPDWASYGQQSPGSIPTGHHVFQQAPPPSAPPGRQNQVYSFVPIPGAQQTKRPRRRWEDIERMYLCNHPLPGGGNCQKAYGTLNHLNAHVQMQHHGPKRTPEEFKEIRKEWKARKKEEEAKRKQAEEAQRNAQAAAQPRPDAEPSQAPPQYPRSQQLPLPPMGYPSQPYAAPTSMPDYGASNAYAPYPYPQAGQGGQGPPPTHPMYSPPNGGQNN